MENFVINEFNSVFFASDPAGRKIRFENRQTSCFIITRKGKIRFTYDGGTLTARAGVPVFLPKGLSYLNECLESAESYVFNFQASGADMPPLHLSAISESLALEFYQRINELSKSPILSDRLSVFETLYALARRLLGSYVKDDKAHPTVTKALRFILQHYESPEITVKAIAAHCSVSEVYLRKLFERELHVSPFRKITELRMKKANMLLEEKRPLKEIAEAIGYSDVFQFSRAYKRHFGYSPSKKEKSPSNFLKSVVKFSDL